MLLCPLLYYGSAREHDMDFGQASVMFRSIFLEGFARPSSGVRVILKVLTRRFKELGGELRLRAGVRRIVADGDEAHHVVARRRQRAVGAKHSLLGRLVRNDAALRRRSPNRLITRRRASFRSSNRSRCSIAPRRTSATLHAILFFNDSEKFHWEKPRDRLTDVRSGVVCSPNNFAYEADDAHPEPAIRMTALANYDRWRALPKDEYQREKAAARRSDL